MTKIEKVAAYLVKHGSISPARIVKIGLKNPRATIHDLNTYPSAHMVNYRLICTELRKGKVWMYRLAEPGARVVKKRWTAGVNDKVSVTTGERNG